MPAPASTESQTPTMDHESDFERLTFTDEKYQFSKPQFSPPALMTESSTLKPFLASKTDRQIMNQT